MTSREDEILWTLCHKVRHFTVAQIAKTWWNATPLGMRRAREAMRCLAISGWLTMIDVLARPLLDLEGPLFRWQLDDPPPAFSSLSLLLKQRWQSPARATAIVLPGKRAALLFGGTVPCVVRNLCQTTHDLHVAEVYLHYRLHAPALAQSWVGEDGVSRTDSDEKRPDALLLDVDGEPIRAVEFGGDYPPERLRSLHEHCCHHHLPYEIW